MAATKKTKKDVKLSGDLAKAVEELARAAREGSVTEEDVQAALHDIDVDAEELSDLMDALRTKGVEVGGEPSAEFPVDEEDAADDDFDDDVAD